MVTFKMGTSAKQTYLHNYIITRATQVSSYCRSKIYLIKEYHL